MPIYQHKKLSGQWRVVIWKDGKPREFLVRGLKRDAERFEAKKRVELDAAQVLTNRASPSFSEFCLRVYAPHAEQHLKGSTWKKVRVYQISTLCEHFGKLKLTDIRPKHVEEFKGARLKAGIKPGSINNELRVLRTILNFAKDMQYPHAEALKFKRLPVRGKPRATAWTAEQLKAMFAAALRHDAELARLFVFLVNTGCRKGEAIACEWGWVDLPAGLLRIPSNEFWQPKNGMPREVPLSSAVVELLTGERAHPVWVFPNRLGGRYVDFPKDRFGRVRTAAGVPGSPHWFRHTFASNFLAAVPDIKLLAEIMGHSHEKITELYTHMLPNHLSRGRNAVDLSPETMGATMGDVSEKGETEPVSS